MRFGPVGLIVYADHFLAAAKSTHAPVTAPAFPLVRTFLVCHALELALKAFLSLKGCSMEQLAGGPFGHNLESLVAEVEKRDIHVLSNWKMPVGRNNPCLNLLFRKSV
jgi:hypothetical protein